jgi:tetratricopeptide (TPR) repeat protein
MAGATSAVQTTCLNCGSKDVAYNAKDGAWECNGCKKRFGMPSPEVRLHEKSVRATEAKTIFFSYGHDDNKELVVLFQKALENRGHTVKIDFKDIGSWDDWRGSITRGIDGSQLTIAFLSAHAIRDPGVCRNEIAIALNRFGVVYPVLLETGIEADIPVTVRNLQWPDLSQWRDIRSGKVPGVDWDRWYEEKLLNLIERLEGEATVFADETSVLRNTLTPSSFESKFVQHIPGFVGREWVMEAYRQWLQQDSRLFWIKAGPGMGKSAISANLAHRERSAIVASWFCDAKSPELKNPANALRSIAFQLALRWEDYRVRLLRQLALGMNVSDETCAEARAELAKKSTHDLFRFLLAEPLTNLIWREHKLVILVDALDEGADEQGANRITELIAREMHALPDWISFVVTSRPEADVVNRLQGFKAFALDTADPRNHADLQTWYRARLGQRAELQALPLDRQQSIEHELIERSGGMILYLKAVEEGFVERSLTVDSLVHLETGLPGLFRLYYDSFTQRFGSDYEGAIKPLLRLLRAAGGPLPKDLACAVLGYDSEHFLACRNRLGSYLIETSAGYEIFHKTLAEWLGADASGAFHVDQAIGRKAIAEVLFAELSDKENHLLRWREAIQKWLPAWLPELWQHDEPQALQLLGAALLYWTDYQDAEKVFRRALAVSKAALPSGTSDITSTLSTLAFLLSATGRYDEAEPLYREALAIREANLPAGHVGIAGACNNLASLLGETGGFEEAELLFRKALAIETAALPAKHLKIAQGLNNLANLLRTIGRYDEAVLHAREALAIFRAALPAGHPDIATACNNLGTLLQTVGQYGEAEPLFREALATQQAALPVGHPSIATTLNNLAELLKTTRRYTEAEVFYREALTLVRAGLPPQHPRVAATLDNLGALLVMTEHYDEAESLFREALAIRLAALPAGHPSIANSFNNLAFLLRTTGRYDEAQRLFSDALAIFRAALPAGHPLIATSVNNLANLFEVTGSDKKAESLYREALSIRKAAFPAGHPDIADSLLNLAVFLKKAGRNDEAEPLFREALAILRDESPPRLSFIVNCLEDLANVLERTDRYEDAEALYREALEIVRAALPEYHPAVADTVMHLADLLRTTGRLEEAQFLYGIAFTIRKVALPAGHPDLANTIERLAELQKITLDKKQGDSLFHKALAFWRSFRG